MTTIRLIDLLVFILSLPLRITTLINGCLISFSWVHKKNLDAVDQVRSCEMVGTQEIFMTPVNHLPLARVFFVYFSLLSPTRSGTCGRSIKKCAFVKEELFMTNSVQI